MELSLKGKRSLVTGAAQGIGRGIVAALLEAGSEVDAVDIDADLLSSLSKIGAKCSVIDVTKSDQLLQYAHERPGFDIAVHVAGGVCGQVGKPIEKIHPDEWNDITAVNQTGAFYLAQAVVPYMKSCGSGRIITISSRAGLDVSLTGIQAYASAKAGQIGLVRQLGHELGQFGITVNCVAPGFVRSNPTTEKQWLALGTKGQKELVNGIAMKRLGTVEDIANAVVFFASDKASWITGQVISVDGGR